MRRCLPSMVLLARCSLVVAVTSSAGCTQIHRTPDLCACSLDRCELIRELDCIFDCDCPAPCTGACGAGVKGAANVPIADEALVCDSGACAAAHCPAPPGECGPPLVRYRPPEPPTFLPVPTAPVFSAVPPDAPLPAPGSVEVGYRRELTFPGRD